MINATQPHGAPATMPGQLLALYLAHAREYDVDAPRALRKVTETI